jgi:hypothetical protein
MKFLTEKQVAAEVKKLIKDETDIRIAVAFWGKGGCDLLGLAAASGTPRVICNLDSGACNPDEIVALRGRSNLRTHPQLHAKIYWTPRGVIIGSSNASTNGLWGEGKDARGWREANILIRNEALTTEVGKWFDAQWEEGRAVTPEMIETSRPLWKTGVTSAPRGRPLKRSLTEAFLADPRHPAWGRVKVAIYNNDLSVEAHEELASQISIDPVLEQASVFEGWRDRFSAGDFVIDVDAIRTRPTVSLLHVGDKLIESDRLTYLWEANNVTLPGLGQFKLSRQEKKQFSALAPRPQAKTRNVATLLTLAQAVKQISKLPE